MPSQTSHFPRLQPRGNRGNILAIVVAILFILTTLVMALHQSQARAVRNVTQAEAELQFRQGYEFEVANLLAQPGTLPPWVKVDGKSELLGEHRVHDQYAKDLWDADKLPNLDPAKSPDYAPGHNTYKITPTTSDSALKVFAQRHKWLVTHDSGGYAAYAPEGKVTLTRAVGWANPTFDDNRNSNEAYSGVQAVVACKSDLEVQEMNYGAAYSLDGPITLGKDSQGAYGFQGSFPLRAFDNGLQNKLDAATSSLRSSARSGDKTAQISGGVLQTVGSMFSMLFGGSGEPSLSLEQSMEVPFPMIPGFSNTVPGIFYEFWLHMPYPPDFASFDGSTTSGEDNGKKIKDINDKIKVLDREIKALDRRIRSLPDGTEKNNLKARRRTKKNKRTDLYNTAKKLKKDMEEESKKNEEEVRNKAGSEPPDEPVTRNDDKDINAKTGPVGWAYSKIFSNFFGLLLDLITGQTEEISKRFANTVRVVHFGRKDNEPDFRFDDGWYMKATFTVPPGRSFAYQDKMEIEGDLWLQKGSVMHVAGDLVLSNPNSGSLNPLKPSGKLIIEEGSTLIVDGDLTCAGQSQYGSLWVASPPGRLAPITTAILVKGKADFPNGSYSATNLEDAVSWLVEKGNAGSLNGVKDVVSTITNQAAPNLAKIVGPFHIRKPFFASYAATFQLTMVPTPVGQIPVPTVIPLPKKNVLVPIFRAFSYVYTPSMNFSLGENLYTHADWWGFGDGVAPVIVKIDPERMLRGVGGVNLGGLNLGGIDWEDHLEEMSTKVLEGAMKFVVETVAKQVVKEVISAAIPGGNFATMALDTALDQLDLKGDALDDLKKTVLDATLGPVVGELERWMDGIRTQVEDGIADGYLREVTGPLVYADTIVAGNGNTRLMAGMLVSVNNIDIDTRTFVGSLTSLKGNITAQRVYYNPSFTRASLYKPKASKSNWIERGLQFGYGKEFRGTTAVDINTGVRKVATEAWNQ